MKKMPFILLLLLFDLLLFSRRIGYLPEVMKPDNINIFQEDLLVAEGSSIFIYGLKDLRFKLKFGRKGEGPGEISKRDAQTNGDNPIGPHWKKFCGQTD
jgi:hypothetical protein